MFKCISIMFLILLLSSNAFANVSLKYCKNSISDIYHFTYLNNQSQCLAIPVQQKETVARCEWYVNNVFQKY